MECTNALRDDGVQSGTPRARRKEGKMRFVRVRLRRAFSVMVEIWGLPLHVSKVINHSSVPRTEGFPRRQHLQC